MTSRPLAPAPTNAGQITPKAISDMVTSDIHACEALLTLLEKERKALQERDLDTLENIIQSKAAQLQHLETSAHTRTQWASLQQSAKPDEDKWRQLMEQQAPELKTQWQKLKSLLSRCRSENEVNGKVLSRNQKTFTRLMTILRGQTGSTNLYNATGGNQSHLPGQSIGEA